MEEPAHPDRRLTIGQMRPVNVHLQEHTDGFLRLSIGHSTSSSRVVNHATCPKHQSVMELIEGRLIPQAAERSKASPGYPFELQAATPGEHAAN
jgi:hypothetical protein